MNFGSEVCFHNDSAGDEVIHEEDMSAGPLGASNRTLAAPPTSAQAGDILPPPPPAGGAAVATPVAGARTWKLKVCLRVSDEPAHCLVRPSLLLVLTTAVAGPTLILVISRRSTFFVYRKLPVDPARERDGGSVDTSLL